MLCWGGGPSILQAGWKALLTLSCCLFLLVFSWLAWSTFLQHREAEKRRGAREGQIFIQASQRVEEECVVISRPSLNRLRALWRGEGIGAVPPAAERMRLECVELQRVARELESKLPAPAQPGR